MARKRKITAEASSTPPPDEQQAMFGFAGYIVSKVLFQELPKIPLPEGEVVASQLKTNISLGYGINAEGNQGEVRFGLTAIPDPRDKPYQVEVEVVGQFVLKSGPKEKFEEFCRTAAPAILFPYVRELVHRTTNDARFGPIRLDPTNIQGLIKPDGWKTQAKTSTALPPPSSQSPSVSEG